MNRHTNTPNYFLFIIILIIAMIGTYIGTEIHFTSKLSEIQLQHCLTEHSNDVEPVETISPDETGEDVLKENE